MNLEDNVINIKFGGDGLKINKKNKLLNFYFTLLNYGRKSMSPKFTYLIGVFHQDEIRKNIELIKPVVIELEQLKKDGLEWKEKM